MTVRGRITAEKADITRLSVDAIVNHWADDDPRWDLLPLAA